MPDMGFTQTPRYQRMMQKLQSIRPEQRAILNTLSMDEQFADEATRRTLAAMAQMKNKEYANKSLDSRSRFANESLDSRSRLADESRGFRSRLADESRGFTSNLADKARDSASKAADVELDLRSRALSSSLGLRREEFDANQDQNRMATGLGIGQVIAEADYGRQRDAIDLETFKQKRLLSARLGQLYGGGA